MATVLVKISNLPITEENFLWWYRATVKRVVDGDTYVLDWDRGGKEWKLDVRVRGYGYNTFETTYRPKGLSDPEWELHKAKGAEALKLVAGLVPPGTRVIMSTYRDPEDDSFGRLLALLFIPCPEGYIDLANTLRANNFLRT